MQRTTGTMKTFYHLLINILVVSTKNGFVWFALTFWIYLQTQSVISTSVIGGLYLLVTSFSGFWFGALVDHHQKKAILTWSSIVTLLMFLLGLLIYSTVPTALMSITSPMLWIFALVLLFGVISGNIYGIVLPTMITTLVAEDQRDKANGMYGTVAGISFAITSVASGITLAYAGMFWVLVGALVLTLGALAHLLTISLPEPARAPQEEGKNRPQIDIKGTIAVIRTIPGLFALIFFTTFNNFLGGVFMALMDAYGLSLVSVEAWGLIWGFLSLGFILGGIIIAKHGLGKKPLQTLFLINIIVWIVCIFFTIQPSIILLIVGIFVWITLMPFIEATEHTIIQKVVPPERQGRVFGFAQSVEQAASPLTSFLIGPITQLIFIPLMTTGLGAQVIGQWYGVGPGRGMAVVFSLTGIIGLCVTLIAMRSKSYRLLADRYQR